MEIRLIAALERFYGDPPRTGKDSTSTATPADKRLLNQIVKKKVKKKITLSKRLQDVLEKRPMTLVRTVLRIQDILALPTGPNTEPGTAWAAT
jgi:hypothetical protein